MYFQQLVVVGALAAQAAAIAIPLSPIVHERRDYTPKSWVKGERLDAATELPVRIGLIQQNLEKGHDMLMDVSMPDSSNYGKHFSAEEVHEMFAPSTETVKAVRDWLVSAGVAKEKISQSINKQWMQLDLPAIDLESLLNTEYHVYKHQETDKSTVACEKYHIPASIKEHVDYITPGIRLFAEHERPNPNGTPIQKRIFGVTSGKGQGGLLQPLLKKLGMAIDALLALPLQTLCGIAITPVCVKTMYKIPAGTKKATGNQMGIFEDLGDVYSQTDLNLFFATLASNIPQGTGPELRAVDGAVTPVNVLDAGAESDLDFQAAYPIIYPQGTVLFQTDDPVYEANYTFEGFFNTFFDAIDGSYCSTIDPLDPPYPDPSTAAGAYKGKLQCGVYKPTNVISISYGGQEADLPEPYQKRQCAEFMKLGMQGISIVLASGDSGVAGPAGDGNTDGCLGTGQILNPDFPATCPYITTVGATLLPPGASAANDAEVAVQRFGSGGGFSNIYPMPSYQQAAVQAYLTNTPPSYSSYSTMDNAAIGAGGGIYNRNGRGYPDVSAVGDNIIIFNKGAPTLIGGTSASAPIFAAILTRINEERLAAGKKTVGFVNPTLYSNPGVLNDVTSGNNPGCNTNGFNASKGWDPVTGLGTPNYPKMLSLFMGLA